MPHLKRVIQVLLIIVSIVIASLYVESHAKSSLPSSIRELAALLVVVGVILSLVFFDKLYKIKQDLESTESKIRRLKKQDSGLYYRLFRDEDGQDQAKSMKIKDIQKDPDYGVVWETSRDQINKTVDTIINLLLIAIFCLSIGFIL